MAIEELLERLADGVYNGLRTDSEMNGVWSGFYIKDGIPYKFREGKGSKFFDNKENVKSRGRRTDEPFLSDKEKIFFFENYGFIQEMFGGFPEVIEFSRDYYERTRGRRK